jgi:lipopolysaccharide transport system ATP-binding protein
MSAAIRIENISKKYILRHQAGGRSRYVALRDVLAHKAKSLFQKNRPDASREEFWALKDVSFEIKPGEVVGIIGRNGAGKSTLLKLLSRITKPTKGRIEIEGRVASLLEVGTGFHPELTGRENIFLNGAILGMHRVEIKKKFDEIVAFAEVEKFLDTPVKHYSSGMYTRLAFAVAAHLEPEILIVDEVLSVGDVQFQQKCIGKMQSVSEKEGRTVLFVSHNLQTVQQMCERVVLLKKGMVDYIGTPHVAINAYMNQSAEEHASAVDLANYPRSRERDGARLLSVKFMDEQGQPASRVRWDMSLQAEVRFRIERPFSQLDISMAVTHAEGQRVFSESYSDQMPKLRLGCGEYSVRLSIPLRFFKLESYFFVIGLFDEGRYGDLVEGLPMPEVVNENADIYKESHRWGIVRIPVTWNPIEPTTGPTSTT